MCPPSVAEVEAGPEHDDRASSMQNLTKIFAIGYQFDSNSRFAFCFSLSLSHIHFSLSLSLSSVPLSCTNPRQKQRSFLVLHSVPSHLLVRPRQGRIGAQFPVLLPPDVARDSKSLGFRKKSTTIHLTLIPAHHRAWTDSLARLCQMVWLLRRMTFCWSA